MRKWFTLFLVMLSASKLFGQTTLVEWNFPNAPDDAIADWGIAANGTKTISAVGGTSSVLFSQAGATTNSASATNWDAGSGAKYWMVEVNTAGYNTITLSSKQRSTNTGPRDFTLEYRIGAAGLWNSVPTGNVSVANDFTAGVLTNLPLPAACDNQPSVFIRWMMSSNTDVTGAGLVAGTGNSNIDDIRIRGILIAGASLPGNYFRSVQSGVWDDASAWETSADNTTWVPASLIPTDAASAITILNTHIITLNDAASANQLTINAGGSLIHNAGVVFSLFDAAGTDMAIFGSYTINGTMPSGTSTIRVETNGSVFAQTNGTPNESDDFAFSTRVTFADQSNFYWSGGIFEAVNITYFPNSGASDHPRFIINANVGAVGSSSQTTINGCLDVRGNITFQNSGIKYFRDGILTTINKTLTQDVSSGAFIMNGAAVKFGGSGTISLGSSAGLEISNGSVADLVADQTINGSGFFVKGILKASDWQIKGSANFDLTGTLYTSHSNGISTSGTLAITGSISLGSSSTIVYDRSAANGSQQFSSRTDYANVQIEGGSGKILNGPATINGLLSLNSGFIVSSSANLLTISASGNSTGASINSFVSGPVKKTGNSAFTFPVGKIVGSEYHYRFIGISAPGSVTDAFTAEFFRSDSYLKGSISSIAKTAGLQRVSRCEFWSLTRDAGSSNIAVTLSWSTQSPCNATYVTKPSAVVAAQYNGTQWGDLFGGSGTGTNTNGTVTWAGANAYEYFTLGSNDFLENPLPLTLSSFSARAKNREVVIDWHVMNNDEQEEYILERSRNGVNFELLRKVPAKGILNHAAYTEVDPHPLYGWNYYRLRAVDRIDREKISFSVKVWFGVKEIIRISPNPASEKIVINLSEPSSISEIELVNISGQVLKKIKNIQFYTELNISHLQAGLYYLRILGKYGLTMKSFVKN